MDEIISGQYDAPYANTAAWKSLQLECPDLRRVHAHLSKGTRPADKRTNATAVKRYLNDVVIGKDGVLVVIRSELYHPRRELIVVPKHLLNGLLTSMHLQLNHASAYQLQKVFARNYYCQGIQKHTSSVIGNCHTCQSLRTVPRELHAQSSTDFPESPSRSYAADVVRRHGQKLSVVRDTFSSFTSATLIDDETSGSLKDALIAAVSMLRPTPRTMIVVRVDNAPGYKSLVGDPDLRQLCITIDLGRTLNRNKNPVIDKCISELITELLKICPDGGKVTPITLSYAVNQLNSRIRGRGLSAWEIMFQRDQNTFEPLDIADNVLASEQRDTRAGNQLSSAKSKSRNGPAAVRCEVKLGSLVYLKDSGDKTKARERFIVVGVDDDFCTVQKMTKSLRNVKYKVKPTEIYPVTPTINDVGLDNMSYAFEDGEEGDTRDDDGILLSNIGQTPTTRDSHAKSPNQRDSLLQQNAPRERETEIQRPMSESLDARDSMPPPAVQCNHDTDQNNDIVEDAHTTPDFEQLPVHQHESAVDLCEAATNESRPGLSESTPGEVPSTRGRPKRHAGPPKRFGDYLLY